MRQLAVFAIALEGAGVLVKPVKDNRPGLAPPYALTQCATPVVPDAADDIADGVAMTDVDLRHDPLQGQRPALEPALHLGPGFVVVVVDASLGHVTGRAEEHTSQFQSLMRRAYALSRSQTNTQAAHTRHL